MELYVDVMQLHVRKVPHHIIKFHKVRELFPNRKVHTSGTTMEKQRNS